MEIVRLEQVTKVYRRGRVAVRALDGVDLAVAPGEFVAIMGPSGSGKSTLLHVMGTLDRPDGGRVWIRGEAVEGFDDGRLSEMRRREIGFVFQFFNLLPTLTAEENVALPFLLAGGPLGRVRERVSARRKRSGFPGMTAGRIFRLTAKRNPAP